MSAIGANKQSSPKSISEILSAFENDTEEYLKLFEENDLIAFTDSKELKNKYLGIYSSFMLNTEKHITNIECHIIRISEAIYLADVRCDAEATQFYQRQFEDYTLFASALTDFIGKSDNILIRNRSQFRVAHLLKPARELLSAIKTYKSKL